MSAASAALSRGSFRVSHDSRGLEQETTFFEHFNGTGHDFMHGLSAGFTFAVMRPPGGDQQQRWPAFVFDMEALRVALSVRRSGRGPVLGPDDLPEHVIVARGLIDKDTKVSSDNVWDLLPKGARAAMDRQAFGGEGERVGSRDFEPGKDGDVKNPRRDSAGRAVIDTLSTIAEVTVCCAHCDKERPRREARSWACAAPALCSEECERAWREAQERAEREAFHKAVAEADAGAPKIKGAPGCARSKAAGLTNALHAPEAARPGESGRRRKRGRRAGGASAEPGAARKRAAGGSE